MKGRTALISGATGLVGSHLLDQLLQDSNYTHIRSVSRKSTGVIHPKLEEIITSLDGLEEFREKIIADHVFCCLGTTIGKAGSRAEFEKVDYEYPLKLATISKTNNASHFIIVTAMGANKNSIFFYNKVKGRVEEAIRQVDLEFYTIIRPSLILGDRKEKRWLEGMGKVVIEGLRFILIGPFRKYRGVQAEDIAKAMRNAALKPDKKERIVLSEEIFKEFI